MEEALLVLGLMLGGALYWYLLLASEKRTQTWQEAAVSCGLQAAEASGLWKLPLDAGAEPLRVRIGPGGDKGQLTRITLEPPGPRDFHLVKIQPESPFRWTGEIETGDLSFDKTFFIEGPARLVLALLDAETRRLLLLLKTEAQLEICSGELRADMPDEMLTGALPDLLEAGQRFAQPMDIPQRLAENARRDPKAGVRLQNLLLLIREYPEGPGTADALRTACSDPIPEIRLRAAKELGVEGRSVLLELAKDPMDDALRAEAVSILDQALPFESVKTILDSARGLRHLQTTRACLEVLGRSGAATGVDVLAEVMARAEDELAVAAAQILGATGSPAAEGPLILALQREEEDLRVAAANALGRVGSPAAVLPLKTAAARARFDLDFRRATRQAIAEIQSRIPGASPGQLSLAHAEAGQLSIATDPAGQLSLRDGGNKSGEA